MSRFPTKHLPFGQYVLRVICRQRMAGVSEKVADHLKFMDADEILSRSSQAEKIDNVARRTFGLDNPASGSGAVNLSVLSGGRTVVQINRKNE
jgi:hypothetical protein